MPGSSLWLLPPRGHPLEAALSKLIAQTAAQFGSPHTFLPHVTLTSDIAADVYAPNPKAWLDALLLPPASQTHVSLGPLASDPVYVRKLYSRVSKPGVALLTHATRFVVQPNPWDLENWLEEKWVPHLSLLYHDCPVVEKEKLREVEAWVGVEGVKLHEGRGGEGEGEGEMGGWTGGRVVLVDTSRPIGEWVPIAERVL
ncbi:2',3'-cyclic-nucleotide 3'-phosphodiesterase-like protein [Paraphaeosphaeria sporulosa]|uniref:2',3'-cyclic-nucleotide 3'-phosphodiesteras-like protein n=1 Tax=Paraphaeosphaeria sporulosa TaxID=1460663 RepID=A0A177CYC3_9PLEO|nr:2',3'-cyclic-nucleotide 3'-phosphodiesterase-like protein [Paraphaeosphaeria sporulosa]OAG12565.1 2',3'-cyclic-nucleotide 3'-phosphodiesteras-like protein [Paraphaeosphaeria sporulosa]